MSDAGGTHPLYGLLDTDIVGVDSLIRLALDMRWSWNHSTDDVWRTLDPELWTVTHNPLVILQTASRERLEVVLADHHFQGTINRLVEDQRSSADAPAWFQQEFPDAPFSCVAYFSMEFMLSEALPIYAGGLGNVAGDQLKAASDLGVPVVGVGLLFQQGYFRQVIDNDGAQQALFPFNDPGQLPITPVRHPNGEWLRLQVSLSGYPVWLRAWRVQVGRVQLYLLDSNDLANSPAHRGITSELYGGGPELRLQQEIVLGIGGWRLLTALGIQPDVCHLNDGHAAFAVLERAREFMDEMHQSFAVSLASTRAGNVFTTHTAVDAAFDRFSPGLIEQYLGGYGEQKLGISVQTLQALGRENPTDQSEGFNMAYLAVRGSGAMNGVSRLHGDVSRKLFEPLFPRWPTADIPVGHVTNGVHMPSWDSAAADGLWTEACGKDRWLGSTDDLSKGIRGLSDERLWTFRRDASRKLVEYARRRVERQFTASGASPDAAAAAGQIFDPAALTLGFGRRFATYKRPNLLLHDPERLLRLLTNPQRPVQLILAGKAHPADQPGQALIQEWVRFVHWPEARPHVIFVSDYDMHVTEHLVHGVDVWLNTPRRPWEASGTSGMKILVNGGLNLSELDGWWAEAYRPEVGWALGDGREHGDDPDWDAAEATALYELLEREVIPEFYQRDGSGIPTAWVARMRESMAQLTPQFSANRTVRDYIEQRYIPAAAAFHSRRANGGSLGREIAEWQHEVDLNWQTLQFGEPLVETRDGEHVMEVSVGLSGIDPTAFQVELYADGGAGGSSERHTMMQVQPVNADPDRVTYRTSIPATRPATDYTPRAIPHHDHAVPLERRAILWQR